MDDADAHTKEVPKPGPDSSRKTDVQETYRMLAEPGRSAAGCCFADGTPAPAGGEVPPGDACEGHIELALGCGDPLPFAALKPGETVLDLGCGAGGDCFRAADAVGRSGRVLGVDMTPAMIATARNRRDSLGVTNVEFRLGEIESLPFADETVDVVLSNCVINLSSDRERVFREAFRVLRPGGRLAICDVLLDGPVPAAVRTALGDAAQGLVEESEYLRALRVAGFTDVQVKRAYPEPTLPAHSQRRLASEGMAGRVAVMRVAETGEEVALQLDEGDVIGRSFSGSVTATKPVQLMQNRTRVDGGKNDPG